MFEKHVKKAKDSETTKSNRIKSDKLKSTGPRKVCKVILWVVVCFVLLKGVVGIFRPSNTIDYQRNLEAFKTATMSQEQLKSDGTAFAEIFAKEYLTYRANKPNEYSIRVGRYIPSYLSDIIVNISSQIDVEAIDSKAISSEVISDSQINVNVWVSEKYGTKGITKDVYLKIPVTRKDGKYAIMNVPEIIPSPELASPDYPSISGNSVDEEKEPGIKNMLSNALKTYCEGNATELSYYFTNSAGTIKGLGGLFKFKTLDDLKMYAWPDQNNFLAVVSFTVFDPDSKQDIKQAIHLELIKKSEKYYIKSLDVGTGSIKR